MRQRKSRKQGNRLDVVTRQHGWFSGSRYRIAPIPPEGASLDQSPFGAQKQTKRGERFIARGHVQASALAL